MKIKALIQSKIEEIAKDESVYEDFIRKTGITRNNINQYLGGRSDISNMKVETAEQILSYTVIPRVLHLVVKEGPFTVLDETYQDKADCLAALDDVEGLSGLSFNTDDTLDDIRIAIEENAPEDIQITLEDLPVKGIMLVGLNGDSGVRAYGRTAEELYSRMLDKVEVEPDDSQTPAADDTEEEILSKMKVWLDAAGLDYKTGYYV